MTPLNVRSSESVIRFELPPAVGQWHFFRTANGSSTLILSGHRRPNRLQRVFWSIVGVEWEDANVDA